MYSFLQKIFAEFVGTFVLVFVTVGAICSDSYLRASGQAGLGTVGIALAAGLAYGVSIMALAPISGGHFNPAVTIGFWVAKRLGTLTSLFYAIAQLAGASAAALSVSTIIPEAVWRPVSLGTPDLTPDFTRMHGMMLEAVITFFLVFGVFATSADPKPAAKITSPSLAGLAAGLCLTIGILVAGPFTGGALNPARVFGPALVAHHWINHGVYWVGPLLGGVVAAVLHDRVFLLDQPPRSKNS